MKKKIGRHSSNSNDNLFSYLALEKRELMACDHVGSLGAGIAVSDDATGPGYILYSEQDVHSRFSLPDYNASHFVAVRINGNQWQFNNDVEWIDFESTETDRLVTEVNFTGDSVANSVAYPIVNGIRSASRFGITLGGENIESDLWFNANRFLGAPNDGEFEVLGTCFDTTANQIAIDDIASRQQQVWAGLLAYESLNGSFPSLATFNEAGQPLLSWRVELLPLLGLSDLYNQFNHDEPWNSPHNLSLASEIPDFYASPNVPGEGLTSIQAVAGQGTLFQRSGIPVEISDIRDGVSNTIAIVEADVDRAVVWTRPADLGFNGSDPFDGVGENGTATFHAITVDGQALEIDPDSDPINYANLLRIDDGNLVDVPLAEPSFNSSEQLQDVGLAIVNYESAFGEFPQHAIYDADGVTPLLSWRVAILPFIGQQVLFDQFHLDEPWDSTHNLSLLPYIPDVYADPTLPDVLTNVLATTGDGTVFELSNTAQSLNDVSDGPSKTTLAVRADADQAVVWTSPQDWVFDPADPTDGLGGGGSENRFVQPRIGAGFDVVFADASVRRIPAGVDDGNFAAMVQRDDGVVVDFDDAPIEMDPQLSLRSLGLAVLNFESRNQEFPGHATYNSDGSQSLLSWRVSLLPFLGEQVLYDQFNHDEPWDSPHNFALLDQMPEIFKSAGIADGLTTFQALTGDNTLFPIGNLQNSFGAISDPTTETILFVQTGASEAVEWTRPADVSFDADNPRNGIGDATGSGFFAVMLDGGTRFIHDSISEATVAALAEINDGFSIVETLDRSPNVLELFPRSANNLRQVALASLNYESSFGGFPAHAIYSEPSPDGVPLLSWRVRLLPFLGYENLFDQFNLDEPWDSPHNLSLLPQMPDIFANPNVPGHMTITQVVTSPFEGPRTAFPLGSFDSTLGSITDGTSNTIGFVEANFDQAVEWTKPQDLFYDDADPNSDPTAGLGEATLGFGNVFSRIDGSVEFLRSCVPSESVRRLLLASDGQVPPSTNCPTFPIPHQFPTGPRIGGGSGDSGNLNLADDDSSPTSDVRGGLILGGQEYVLHPAISAQSRLATVASNVNSTQHVIAAQQNDATTVRHNELPAIFFVGTDQLDALDERIDDEFESAFELDGALDGVLDEIDLGFVEFDLALFAR